MEVGVRKYRKVHILLGRINNPFAVILRYEEISFVSMTLGTMTELVELAYQWACAETSTHR
jgi:hypothetical protein